MDGMRYQEKLNKSYSIIQLAKNKALEQSRIRLNIKIEQQPFNQVFNTSTHIAAIKTTGNVFCYEAIEELNIKAKNYKDLLTDEPFVRSDIIVLQDPRNTTKFNLSGFHHIKNSLKVDNEELERAKTDPKV